MEAALTEEKAKDHIDRFPVEATEDEAAVADVKEQMIVGAKVEVREGLPIQHALPGESSDSGDNIRNGTNGKKIFVGGLPSDLKIEEFSSFFKRFGEITDVVIIPDAVTRRSRGFGFVTFGSKQSVNEVLKSSRYIIKDKNVEVKLAIRKQEIQQSIENRPIVNGYHYYTQFPYEIRPDIYGYHHHFNAFTLIPAMSGFSAAPLLYGNSRTSYSADPRINFEEISRRSGIRITRPISKTVHHHLLSPSHSSTNNMHDRGSSSSVDRQSGAC